MHLRALHTDDDLRQCIALQRATWGSDYDDIVPASILIVAQKIGGVVAGAFDPDGRIAGFVFGMAGVRKGEIIHWSDMLAVREDARDRGVGQALKEFQRREAKAGGAAMMYWTYDPLVARNAHLNFNRLGVRVDEYVEDMYGASESELHRGLGTDRFIVAWALDGEDMTTRAGSAEVPDGTRTAAAPVLNANAETLQSSRLDSLSANPPATVRVEIPLDIVRVRDASPAEAARWRTSTRAAFQWALARRYEVKRFITDSGTDRGHYLLARNAPSRA